MLFQCVFALNFNKSAVWLKYFRLQCVPQITQLYRCFWLRLWLHGSAVCLALAATILASGCTSIRGRLVILLTIHSTFSTWPLLTQPAVTTGVWSIASQRRMEFQPSMQRRWMTLWRSLPTMPGRRTCSVVISYTTPLVVIIRSVPGCAKGGRSVLRPKWNSTTTRGVWSLPAGSFMVRCLFRPPHRSHITATGAEWRRSRTYCSAAW